MGKDVKAWPKSHPAVFHPQDERSQLLGPEKLTPRTAPRIDAENPDSVAHYVKRTNFLNSSRYTSTAGISLGKTAADLKFLQDMSTLWHKKMAGVAGCNKIQQRQIESGLKLGTG